MTPRCLKQFPGIVEHVRKFYLLRHNANLGFQMHIGALCALNFKTQLLIENFMSGFGMVDSFRLSLIAWWLSALNPMLGNLKARVRSFRSLEFT
jgi:hypothetical protein